MTHPLSLRIIGFVSSLLLTLLAYFIIIQPESFGLEIRTSIVAILSLAALQAMFQVIFFIDVWQEKGTFWNLAVFVSTLSIIAIIVLFSIWIMHHLDYNMLNS